MDSAEFVHERLFKKLYPYHIPSGKELKSTVLKNIPSNSHAFTYATTIYKMNEKTKKKDFSTVAKVMAKRLTGGFIVSPNGSKLYSTTDIKSSEGIEVISTASKDFRTSKAIATWIVEEATFPFVAAYVGVANFLKNLKVSESEDTCYLCIANEESSFSLKDVRQAVTAIKPVGFKDFAKAYTLKLGFINPDTRELVRDDYIKLLKGNPEMAKALQQVNLVKGSVEWSLVKTYFS